MIAVPADLATRLLGQSGIAPHWIKAMGRRLSCCERDRQLLAVGGNVARVASFLVQAAGSSLVIEGMSQAKIADKLCLSRGSFSKALGYLKGLKLIKVERQRIIVVDRAGLNGLVPPWG